MDFDAWMKYLLYPLCKKAVASIAQFCGICLWGILISFLVGIPLSFSLYQMGGDAASALYIMGNYCAILLSLLLCGFLGIILPWCHTVLMYQRGWYVTRDFSLLGCLAGIFILVSTLWSIPSGATILPNQSLAPFMLMVLIWVGIISNWGNMMALSLRHRIGLSGVPLLMMLVLLLGFSGFYLLAALLYLPLFFILRAPLRWLRQHAELIVELPPLPEDKKPH